MNSIAQVVPNSKHILNINQSHDLVLLEADNANLFTGKLCGSSNKQGFYNSFYGTACGEKNTTGEMNSFFGTNAGNENLIGNHNSFFGSTAGAQNTNGFGNSFFGASSGNTTNTGHSNSFFGANAGTYNTTGFGNCFIGRASGFHNVIGNNNIFIGNKADATEEDLDNAIAIGAEAKVSTSNCFVLGNNAVIRWGFGISPSATHIIEFNPTITKASLSLGGVWLNEANANKMDNVETVNHLLAKIARVNITQWSYATEAKSIKHIGPTAENFNDVFKTNDESSTTLSASDMAGVAILGVKELAELVKQLQQENTLLKERLTKLEASK
jgi:hypothetical protein